MRGAVKDPLPLSRAATQPSGARRPRPTFDAGHGGDVAPGSGTRGGGGGGGRETGEARQRRPDNTRKCATQHFRRRLALARGYGGRAGLGAVEPTPFFPAVVPAQAWRSRLGCVPAWVPFPFSPQARGSSTPNPPSRILQPSTFMEDKGARVAAVLWEACCDVFGGWYYVL